MMSTSRIELPEGIVTRLQQRVPEAYEELFRIAGPALLQFAANITRSSDAAEDVVQEVVYRIWELGECFRPSGSVVSYLFTAVRNRALNAYRDEVTEGEYRRRAVNESQFIARLVDSQASPDISVSDLADRIRGVLLTLPERQRTAFDLRYGRGMTVPEIAEVLGITPGSAGNLLTRATKTVRDQ